MTLIPLALKYAEQYGHNLKGDISEIMMRSAMPPHYASNARQLANAKRRLRRALVKCQFAQTKELMSEFKPPKAGAVAASPSVK